MKIFVWGCVALGLLSGLGTLVAPYVLGSSGCSNERNASASLKTLASAQADYRGNDRDGNKVQDFWRGDISGLYGILPAGDREMIKLIEISVAGADAAPLGKASLGEEGPGQVHSDQYTVFAPKAGYFFLALRHADEDPDKLDPNRFAACAYPDVYRDRQRMTYILCEDNTIFQKDLGGRPPDVFPADLEKEGWRKLDGSP